MTHASLFSGIGGAELAAAWMGWRNLFHCEINPFGRQVLEYWFPDSKSYEDITTTDFTPWQGRVDVLTGGFPCQPFSLAGRRKGAEDDRYLWPQMLRAIREILPTWVVGENVAGLATMVQPGETVDMGRTDNLFEESHLYRTTQRFTLDEIITSLEDSGYSVQAFLIPACAVEAPHRRDRLWIVAHCTDSGVEGQQTRAELAHSIGPAADANSDRLRLGENKQISKPECSRETNISSTIRGGDTSVPTYIGWFKKFNDNGESQKSQQEECGEQQSVRADCPQDWWRQFPSVSPVCRGNDGLSFDISRLTISEPKWRAESIKAMGNAWVPQVAYEIFRAIEKE